MRWIIKKEKKKKKKKKKSGKRAIRADDPNPRTQVRFLGGRALIGAKKSLVGAVYMGSIRLFCIKLGQ